MEADKTGLIYAVHALHERPQVAPKLGRGCLQAEELKLNCEIWSTYILMNVPHLAPSIDVADAFDLLFLALISGLIL